MFLPISYAGGIHGFGPWERCLGRLHPLDLWGRYGTDHLHPINPLRSVIPRPVQLGFGDMHLDDWIAPSELVGAFLQDMDKRVSAGAGGVIVEDNGDKNIFQVKLNVKDYKPEELNVKISNGLVTIEGKHEVSNKDKDKEEYNYSHFKRSFTVPKNVIEDKIECKITDEGELIMVAPVRAIELPPEPRAIPINAVGAVKDKTGKADGGKGDAKNANA